MFTHVCNVKYVMYVIKVSYDDNCMYIVHVSQPVLCYLNFAIYIFVINVQYIYYTHYGNIMFNFRKECLQYHCMH